MKQTADRYSLTELVEARHCSLGLQDLDLNTEIGQNFQGFSTDLKSLPDSFERTTALAPCSINSCTSRG
jgi:hypothetical protein